MPSLPIPKTNSKRPKNRLSTDHSLNAQIASLEDLMTTTLANNAQLDKLKIQET
jgi:hypothetical protein